MPDYLNQINPKRTNQFIEEILIQAKELNTPIVSEEAINLIIQTIKVAKAKRVLEIGTAIGFSAIMMATFTDAEVFTIERDLESYKLAVENVSKAGLDKKITLIRADAIDYELNEDMKFDLIFIDAAKAAYIKFFEKYSKYLTKNGIIITDNLLFHGLVESAANVESKNLRQLVKKIDIFNKFLIDNPDFDSYIYEIGDGLSISIKK